MSLDVTERPDSRDGVIHVHIGPVEKAIVSATVLGIVGFIGWAWNSGNAQLSSLSRNVNDLATQQAVTNSRLDTLSVQLANVPGLTKQLAELRVEVQRNSEDIHELQGSSRKRP